MKIVYRSLIIFLTIAVLEPTLAQVNLQNGLIGYYPFDSDARDYSGNGNDLVITNANLVQDKDGHKFSAINFNGSNSKLESKTNIDFGNTTTMGFSLWVNSNSSSISYFLSQGQYGIASGSTQAMLVMYSGATNNASGTIVSGQWTHLAGYYDGQNIKMYVNGTLTGSTFEPNKIFTSGILNIGFFGNAYWNGTLDEIALYNRPLTNQEITALYNRQAPVLIQKPTSVALEKGIVAYYPFDGDLKDKTIHGYDFTSTGTNFVADNNSNAASAISFNNSSPGLTSKNLVDFGGSTTVGFSVWINSNVSSTTYFLNTNQFALASNSIQAYFVVNSGATNSAYAPITSGQWTHMAGYYDGEYLKLFINGTLAGITYQPGKSFSQQTVKVGNAISTTWTGSLDELVFYNRVLTDNEIVALYNRQNLVVLPTVTGVAFPQVCSNRNLSLTATATNFPESYHWDFSGASVSVSSQKTPLISFYNPGINTLTVVGTNAFGSSSPFIQTVTVIGSTNILSQPVSLDICNGTTTSLSVMAEGENLSFLWSNLATSSLVSGITSGTYTVTVSGTCGHAVSNPTIIGSVEITSIVNQPTSVSTCSGTMVLFEVSVAGANLQYNWNTGSQLPYIQTSTPGIYTLTATGTCGTVISNSATLSTTSCPVTVSDDYSLEPFSAITPNPNSGSFTLDLGESGDVVILNSLGVQIWKGYSPKGKLKISLENIEKGIYMVLFNSKSNRVVIE